MCQYMLKSSCMLRRGMNLLEFLGTVKMEDHDEVWNRVLHGGGIRAMVTFDISVDGSEEDIINQIAANLGRPVEVVRKMPIMEKLAELKAERLRVQEFTKEYSDHLKSLHAPKGKFDELDDLGRLLTALKSDAKIQIPAKEMDYPDFIIEESGKKIGIEHTRLLDRSSKENIEFIRSLLKRAEQIIIHERPDTKGLLNVELDYSKEVLNGKTIERGKFNAAERENVSKEIANYIKSMVIGREIPKPSYILSVRVASHQSSPLSIKHVENFVGKSNLMEVLHKTMKPKEDRFKKYLQIDSFDEIWLFISIQSLSTSASYNLDDLEEQVVLSQFDKVVLFDLVSRKPIFLKLKRFTN